MKQLVFVHGRAQQGRDALAVKQEWIDTWKRGLAKNGLALPIPEDQIRFPFFGDTLDQLVHGATAEEAARVIVRGTEAGQEEKEFMRAYLAEVLEQTGVTEDQVRAVASAEVAERGPLNWGWVQAILSAIDTHVPGGSGASVALFTRDVYQYLKNPGLRDVIDAGVRQAFTPGVPTVVVGHSLGSVVSYNVLRRDGEAAGWQVPLYVTVGSPLAVKVIRNSLRPLRHPRCAKKWFNAMDDRDVVALYPLDRVHFDIDPAIENKTDVRNETDNRHGIRGYLDDAEVARRLHEALVGP